MTAAPDQWAALISDPVERGAWIRAFGIDRHAHASTYLTHFTDPIAARAWSDGLVPPHVAAYLHGHGVTPDNIILNQTLKRSPYTGRTWPEACDRAALDLIHPRLPRADRDALLAAGLTLPEIDALLSTGPYDRDTIAFLGGLQ